MFDHEKLDVYKISQEFIIFVDQLIVILLRGKNYLVEQLQRASTSISLNIAEGAKEFSIVDKCKFYRIARRSPTECAGILDVCKSLNLIVDECHLAGKKLLVRIVAMLTKMAQISGTGAGAGLLREGYDPS